MHKKHPCVERSRNENVKIWRYLDFTKFVSLLDRQALFFCRADKLSDPFEGSVSKANLELRRANYERMPKLAVNVKEFSQYRGDYTQDIRAGISQTRLKQIWNFQVKTDQIDRKIVLEWKNTSAFPEDLQLYLMDPSENVLANMREKSSYSFISSSSLESFKIIATSEALPLPEDLDLIEVYSYPNPAHGKGVQFHFYLASSAKVSIKIYSISGELVKTLINEKACVAGAYEEFWKEHNDRGEKLARGVYIYIIQAGNSAKVVSKSGKIGLLD